MTFALQSNKKSSICLTVRYFQIGFSTKHLEHFQNIATLNTQPSGQMWGGDEELEAERLNCGRIPIRTLGFWVFIPRAECPSPFCWVRHPAWQRAISISAANWASFNLYSAAQEEWDLREVIPHEPRCLTPPQLSGFRGSRGCGPCPAPVSAVLCMTADVCSPSQDPPEITLMVLSLLLILPSHKHQKSGFKQGALFLLQGTVPVFSISGPAIPTEVHICFLLR